MKKMIAHFHIPMSVSVDPNIGYWQRSVDTCPEHWGQWSIAELTEMALNGSWIAYYRAWRILMCVDSGFTHNYWYSLSNTSPQGVTLIGVSNTEFEVGIQSTAVVNTLGEVVANSVKTIAAAAESPAYLGKSSLVYSHVSRKLIEALVQQKPTSEVVMVYILYPDTD